MKKGNYFFPFLLLFALFFSSNLAFSTIHTINVSSNVFTPDNLNVIVGDTVRFQWIDGFHTTTCDPMILAGTSHPIGADPWDAVMSSGTPIYEYVVTVPGTYIYGCQPHWPGMSGTINAGFGYKLWDGEGDGISWNDALNWFGNTLPSATDSVLLNNEFVPFTYVVNLPTGAVNTVISKIIIQPADPNFIYLNLTSGNTNNPGLTVGNSDSLNADFLIYERGVFQNQSGAAAGLGVNVANSKDTIKIFNGGMWVHNTGRGTSGLTNKLSRDPLTAKGIFRYDVPTLSAFSITASGLVYGTLQLYGSAGGGGLMSKKYIRTGTSPLTVRGDFYIQEQAYDSSAMTSGSIFSIGGDWSVYGKMEFSPNSNQSIRLNGTTLQTITGNLSTFIPKTVEFNNSAGFLFNQSFYIDSVRMTSGNINSSMGAWLCVGYDATNPGTLIRTGGIVTGQLERWFFDGVVSDSLEYPVGTSDTLKLAKVRYTTPPTVQGRIGIRYFHGNDGTDLTVPLNDGGFSVTRRSNAYWNLSSTLLVGGAISLSIDGNGQTGITSGSDLRVIWSNDEGMTFSLPGTHVSGFGSTAKRDNIVFPFSRFYQAGNSVINPLPVELSSFMAATIKNEVILDWSTSREINNSGFDLQRADISQTENDNSPEYVSVAFIPSKGNSETEQRYKFNDRNLNSGRYLYRLKQVDFNGNFRYYNLNSEIEISIPNVYALNQNYPNPFNPNTTISFELSYDSYVNLDVFDLTGRKVSSIINGNIKAGYNQINFDGSNLASGVYYYRLIATSSNSKFEKILKMLLVK